MVSLENIDPDQPANESELLYDIYKLLQEKDTQLSTVMRNMISMYMKFPTNKQNYHILKMLEEAYPEYFI